MRRHVSLSLMFLLIIAMLMSLGLVSTGRAQNATPEATPTALAWSACAVGGGWECAALPVPLDYANSTGPTIDIALTRLPAADPARRIGALVVNCGGPGCPTVTILHQLGMVLFPDETRARFDLVGFDPRGVGESGQIDCRHDYDAYYAIDPSPDDDAEWEAWLAGGRSFAASCAANGGDLLPFLGTENVVSDMERLREALGEETISFLGLSYGVSVGARYADRYPDRVRAFALDSALPAVIDTATFVPEWVDAIERAFDAYLADCAVALTCPFHSGGDPAAAFDALIAEVDAAPLQVSTESGTGWLASAPSWAPSTPACPGRSSGPGSAPPSPRPPAATARRCSPWPTSATSDRPTAAMDLATRCSWPLAASILPSPGTPPRTRR